MKMLHCVRVGLVILCMCSVGFALVACDDDDDDAVDSSLGPGNFQANYRTSNEFFTNMTGAEPGDSPHGVVQIWYSGNLRNVIDQPTFTVPEGSVAIKEFHTDSTIGFEGIVVMVKKEPGFDPANGDWEYQVRDANATLQQQGALAMCIGCHVSASAADYLAGTQLTGPENGPGAFQPDYAASADFFTNMTNPESGNSPHGTSQIWYSSNIRSYIGLNSFEVPEGTVAVKEFDNDGTLGVDGIVTMIKRSDGFDPANGNWEYERRDAAGNLLETGAISMCSSCHASAAATDYLAGTGLAN